MVLYRLLTAVSVGVGSGPGYVYLLFGASGSRFQCKYLAFNIHNFLGLVLRGSIQIFPLPPI